MSQPQQPNHITHVPVQVDVESLLKDDILVQRDKIPTPSLWQEGVTVTNRADPTRTGVVRRVDHVTNQFRLVGEPRTSWESFDQWAVLVEKSPEEKRRDADADLLRAEIEALTPDELLAVEALIDDPDPSKALKKLNGLRLLGVMKPKVTEPIVETKGKK